MSEEIKQSLGYKPEIKYEEDYSSNINILDSNVVNHDVTEETNDPIQDLGDKLESLGTMIDNLPGNIGDSINNVFEHVEEMWEEELKDKEYEIIPDENEWEYDFGEDSNTGEFEDDEDWGNDEDEDSDDLEDPFEVPDIPKIENTHTSKKDIIEKEYVKHLTDVLNDYTTKLHNSLANFWAGALIATYNKNTDDKKFILNNILISSKDVLANKSHLLDFGIRSQIYKDAKLDFHENMFSREETLMHLKQFKIAYEMRKKYVDIKVPTGATKTSTMDANVLKAMSITYDKKYDVSFDNLYRYLNSSVTVIDDVLKTFMQEIKAKQTLIEGDGIKK